MILGGPVAAQGTALEEAKGTAAAALQSGRPADALDVLTRAMLAQPSAAARAALLPDWLTAQAAAMPGLWGLPMVTDLGEGPSKVRDPSVAEIAEIAALTQRIGAATDEDGGVTQPLRAVADDYTALIGRFVAIWGEEHPATAAAIQQYSEFLFRLAARLGPDRAETAATLTENARGLNRRSLGVWAGVKSNGYPPLLLAIFRAAEENAATGRTGEAISFSLTVADEARRLAAPKLEAAALALIVPFDTTLTEAGLYRPILIRLGDLAEAAGRDAGQWTAALAAVPAPEVAEVFQTARHREGLAQLSRAVEGYARVLPASHPDVVKLKQVVGMALLRTRSPYAALPYLSDVTAVFRRDFGAGSDIALEYRLNLAEAQVASGQAEAAEADLDALLDMAEALPPALRFRALDLKLRALLGLGRQVAAFAFAERTLPMTDGANDSVALAGLMYRLMITLAINGAADAAGVVESDFAAMVQRLGPAGQELLLEYAVTVGLFNVEDVLARVGLLTDLYTQSLNALGTYHVVTRDARKWLAFHMLIMTSRLEPAQVAVYLPQVMALLDLGIAVETEIAEGTGARLAELYTQKALALHRLDDLSGAVDAMRRAEGLLGEALDTAFGAVGQISEAQVARRQDSVAVSAMLRWDLADETGDAALRDRLRDEAFREVQTSFNAAGLAIVRAAARGAEDAPGLSALARRYDDLMRQRLALDGQMGTSARRARLQETLRDIEARLSRDHPAFLELAAPTPVSVADVQTKLLKEGEALIYLVPGAEGAPGFVWAISQDRAAWARVAASRDELSAQIAQMHAGLDVSRVRGAVQLDDAAPGRLRMGFDRALAHDIYRALFGDPGIAAVLEDATAWTIVPRGPFLSLPFSALVTQPPQGADDDPAALRATDWLGLERAVQVAPSVSGLAVRRRAVAAPIAPAANGGFFGLGDPLFAGVEGAVPVSGAVARGGVAISAAVKDLPRLPGTRLEITGMAEMFQAGSSVTLLGADATETRLAALSADGRLGQARIAVFATHGLISGAFAGLDEPALALTPPEEPRLVTGAPLVTGSAALGQWVDDGLLRASEAAMLSLNADWVLLSACDTAAAAAPEAEGLSGLAQAFLYAGARALLVSHWPVDDLLTAELTTRTLTEMQAGATRAEAVRRAMAAIVQGGARVETAHPAYWAPFQLVSAE